MCMRVNEYVCAGVFVCGLVDACACARVCLIVCLCFFLLFFACMRVCVCLRMCVLCTCVCSRVRLRVSEVVLLYEHGTATSSTFHKYLIN